MAFHKNYFFSVLFFIPFPIAAESFSASFSVPETNPVLSDIKLPETVLIERRSVEPAQHIELDAHLQKLKQDQALTEKVLNYLLPKGSAQTIQLVLDVYRSFANPDPLLIARAETRIAERNGDHQQAMSRYQQILAKYPDFTPIRIQYAQGLMSTLRHKEAQTEFQKILSSPDLPPDLAALIRHYQQAVEYRDRWKFSAAANYVRERNVNNASSASQIENTGFVKNSSMLPQTAHGINYYVAAEKDFNFYKAHYLHFQSYLSGVSYWDNHDYDEMTSRTYLGYIHKWATKRLSFLPFYERHWYANHRYKNITGARISFNQWLTPKLQLALSTEYGKSRYYDHRDLNGNGKFVSLALHWFPTQLRHFSVGSDFYRESTALRNYSYDLKTVRLGWTEEWGKQIVSRLNYSFSERHYKDNLILGRGFRFSRPRIDRIYQVNATVWKKDWALPVFEIVPKLQFRWKKQRSTFPSLYNYTDRSLSLLIEKSF